MAPKTKKGPSIPKTLLSLFQSDPSNRTCADCRSTSVDPSQVFASFCPSIEETNRVDEDPEVSIAFHDFVLTHRAFAPPDVAKQVVETYGTDPSKTINQRFGGHGLFICAKCSEAHKVLGTPITKVLPVQDAASWTQEQARFMRNSGGNARSWIIYEAYMPEAWKKRRPIPSSSLEDRIIFCRAKYQALAFAIPPPGPLSEMAWTSILQRNETGKRYNSADLANIHRLTPSYSSNSLQDDNNNHSRSRLLSTPPNRLIDYFCVVSSAMHLHPLELKRDLSTRSTPEELQFWPHVADCYPTLGAHSDMKFPEHLPNFILPNGCCPSRTQEAPTFHTFVLTLGDGDRLYGGALQIYDDHVDMEELREAVIASGYEGALPTFLEQADIVGPDDNVSLDDSDDSGNSDIVFFPKCLVLLSHYPYFDLFRQTLLQLYRITFVEAPLPIERYIANLVSEIPLPPQGKIRVEFGFTTQRLFRIERPPPNKLPMANFSFRPLFASLSVSNIMVVLGCLLEECRVALLSRHSSILTPVAEALLSALFPFDWQGLYIPLMPYSMLDILDAPVPFLVGLDSRYLRETPTNRKPLNVVFVDLDRDVVHLGIDEVTEKNRTVPCLPPRDAMKLKTSLDEAGGSMYLIPDNGIKGCIMEGWQTMLLVPNEERPKYAQMQTATLNGDSYHREQVLSQTAKAYDEHELSEGIAGFRTIHGQMKYQEEQESVSSGSEHKTNSGRIRRRRRFRRRAPPDILSSSGSSNQAHLLDMVEPDGFSSMDIRNAFLRFMVATFANYGKYIIDDRSTDLFDEHRFLRDLGEDQESTEFIARVLKTQMFQHFLEARMEDPDHPEIRFFDESILAKLNRSKVTKMAKGGKLPTPFLDDESGKISKTFTPPPPSNVGLPDSENGYRYDKFPTLEPAVIGRVRHPVIWEDHVRSKRFISKRNSKVRKTQQDIVKKALNPLTASAAIAAAAWRSARDLETALITLRDRHRDMFLHATRPSKKKVKGRGKESSLEKSSSSISAAYEKEKPDRTVTTLSRADTIMISARRKQSILLDIIIELQAAWRMYEARRRFITFRGAVVHLQGEVRRKLVLLSYQRELHLKRMNALCIQRTLRRFLAYRRMQQIKSAVLTLQRTFRGHAAAHRYARQRKNIITIQKHARRRRTRFTYLLLKILISKVQARVRAIQVRKRIFKMFQQKMLLYREQIFLLWQLAHVPLSLRTKLWPALSSEYGFARLRLAESELMRMWNVLGMNVGTKKVTYGDEATDLGTELGADNSTYIMCKQMMVKADNTPQSEFIPPKLQQAYEVEEAERLQIHERMNSIKSDKVVGKIFWEFGIPPKDKMKKVAVARSIWTNYKMVSTSRSTMMSLFPELESSLNIAFHTPSGKSKRRFPDAVNMTIPPVDTALWEDISLEGRVKKYVREVTSVYITKVPNLMSKLDNIDKRKETEWTSLRIALGWTTDTKGITTQERNMVTHYLQA